MNNMTSVDIVCGSSAENDTWQQDIEGSGCYGRMMLVLTSHAPLVLVSASYLGLLSGKSVSLNLRKSEIILVRLVIAILSAALPIWGILTQLSQGVTGVRSDGYLIDVAASLVWVILALCLWKLSTQGAATTWPHLPVIAAWVLTSLVLCFRLTDRVQHLKSQDEAFWASEGGVVFAWAVLQIIFLVSLLPTPGQSTVSQELGGTPTTKGDGKEEEEVLASSSNSTSETIEVGVAEDNASIVSRLTFGWAEQLMRKGALGQIEKSEDVFLLPKDISSQHAEAQFSAIYPQGSAAFAEDAFGSGESDQTTHAESTTKVLAGKKEEAGKITLLRALIRAFGKRFLLCGLLRLANHICNFSGPLFIYALISFIEDQNEPTRYGIFYASGLVLTTFLSALTGLHFHCQITKVAIKIRAALMTGVYRKSLAVSATALSAFTTAEITNIMGHDTDRITGFGHTFHSLWSIPLEIIIAMFLLYQQVRQIILV